LLHQPEHTREVLADVIAREVTPHPAGAVIEIEGRPTP
jgi:hypothetical protein